MELTAVLTPAEEGGYIALNPETGTTTQGETVEEAVANLKEATALYLSEFPLSASGHPVVTIFSLPARVGRNSVSVLRRMSPVQGSSPVVLEHGNPGHSADL